VVSYFFSRFPVQQLLFSTQGHYQPFLSYSSSTAEDTCTQDDKKKDKFIA